MEIEVTTRSGNPPMKSALTSTDRLRQLAVAGLGFSICLSAMLMLSACDVDSADNVIRSISADINGVYRHDGSANNGGKFVSQNTGGAVTSLDVRQAGDQLEAIDNNGIIFRGTVGSVTDNNASFNLKGATTAGNGVTISGNIQISGNQGTMRATWIEDSLFGSVYGVANGPTVNTNLPPVVTTVYFRVQSPLIQNEMAEYKKTALWFLEG